MPLTPEAHHALYSNEGGVPLEAQLEAALARNIAGGLVGVEATSLASVAIAALAEAEVLASATSFDRVEGLSSLSSEIQTVIYTSHYASKEVFSSIDREPPSIAEFAAAGIDFKKLAAAHETMTNLDLKPEVVFAPILTLDEWRQTYQALQDNPRVNKDGRIKDGGLWLHKKVEENWDVLQTHTNAVRINGHDWEVLVMPSTARPSIVNSTHSGMVGIGYDEICLQIKALEDGTGVDMPFDFETSYPTIDSYLALQAAKLHTNNRPVDDKARTWLSGEVGLSFGQGGLTGCWQPSFGKIHITSEYVWTRQDNLGVRLPIWGNK